MTTLKTEKRDVSRPEFIAIMAGLMALNAVAIDIMLPALPYMGEALGVTNENDRHWVILAYTLGFGVSQLAFGPLSDRFGRRNPMFIGLVVYIIAVIAAVFAPNFATLLVLRVIQGMGAAGTRVITTSIVRDRYSGNAMAEVMSLIFMVFMVIPIIAPSIGQVILLTGPWEYIFIFMGVLAFAMTTWAFIRLPETLDVANRRPLSIKVIAQGFGLVFTNRIAVGYSLAGTFLFGALFGFITTSQQIYVDIYQLGALFPIAFAAVAALMSVASFLNSRIVSRVGMRHMSHFAVLGFVILSGVWFGLSLIGPLPLWVFMSFLGIIMCMFGWASSNMNSLAMEPLGAVAGTASSVFGFVQTVGGAILGGLIGAQFNGTIVPLAGGFFAAGVAALISVLFAEKGKLFVSHRDHPHMEVSRSAAQ